MRIAARLLAVTCLIGFLAALVLCDRIDAQEAVSGPSEVCISGMLVDEEYKPIPNGTVTVNCVTAYTSVNMESTLMLEPPSQVAEKAYVFYSHPTILSALAWAGVDFVNLGNNHIYDYLDAGLESTINALENSTISYSGAGFDESEAIAAHRENFRGVDYSFLGFVGWRGNSTPSQVAEGMHKGGAALGELSTLVSAVEKEATAGRTVVAQYHGGSEYSYYPTEETRQRLHVAVDHGADVVIGHHPHVLQGFELYQGKLIAYSLGNFLFDQYRYETQRSAMIYVWMDGEEFHRAEIVPLYIQNYHPIPATGKMRQYVLHRLLHQSAAGNLMLSVSGGHGVITSTPSTSQGRECDIHIDMALEDQDTKIKRLPFQWYQLPLAIQSRESDASYRFGKDILLLGGFESHLLFGLSDTEWQYSSDDSCVIDTCSHRGRCSLRIAPSDSTGSSFARQKYFFRFVDENAALPMTMTGCVRATGPAELSVGLDLWPSDMSRTLALESPQEKCFQTINVSDRKWQQFAVNLGPLGRSLKGFKICLKNVHHEGAGKHTVYLDDLALIAWETKTQPQEHEPIQLPSTYVNYLTTEQHNVNAPPIVLEMNDLTQIPLQR